MSSATLTIRVGGHEGYLFAGILGSGLCFVPAECVRLGSNGSVEIDEIKYVRSGWAKKNALSNPDFPGRRLFPDPRTTLTNLENKAVAAFLGQFEAAYVD